jgi:prolyl oligopeptidase
VANGDGGEFAQYLRGSDGVWTQLTRFEDNPIAPVSAVYGVFDDFVIPVCRADIPPGVALGLAAPAPIPGKESP